MAHKIVKDSHLAIFVAQVKVAEPTAKPTDDGFPKVNDIVHVGAKFGLVGAAPHLAEGGDGWYTTVDTAATIRVSGVAGTFADGDTVFLLGDGTLDNATGAGAVKIGYADRKKTDAAEGDLWVQLVPSAG